MPVFDKEAQKKKFRAALDLDDPQPEPTPPVDPEPQPEPEPVEPTPEPEPEPQPPVEPTPPVDPEPQPEPDPQPEPEPTEPTPEPTAEDDLFEDIPDLDEGGEGEEGTEEPFTEEELENLRRDDSAAVQQAREKGRLAKQLQAEVDELQLQIGRIEDEKEKALAELEKAASAGVNPMTHPDFVDLKNRTRASIMRQARSLPFPVDESRLNDNWGTTLAALRNVDDLPMDEQEQELSDIRLAIAKDLSIVDSEATSLTWDDDPEGMGHVNQVIGVLQSHLPQFDQMKEVYDTIQEKANKQSLAVGYDEYEAKVTPLRDRLDAVVALTEEEIAEDPESLESVAAKRIQNDKGLSRKYTRVRDSLLELTYGPRVLSQEELDRIKATGKDMKEFHKNRDKRVAQLREEWLPQIAMLLTLKPDVVESYLGSVKAGKNAADAKNRRSAVRNISNPKPNPEPEPTPEPQRFTREEGRRRMAAALEA